MQPAAATGTALSLKNDYTGKTSDGKGARDKVDEVFDFDSFFGAGSSAAPSGSSEPAAVAASSKHIVPPLALPKK